MEDFKTSTRAMLEVVRGEMARLKKRMEELASREATILKWIEAEEGPQPEAGQRELPVIPPRRQKPSLQDFLREVMQDGRARTNAELGEVAKLRGIVPENIDLRSIHSTMMSLMNSNEVVRRDDKWIRKT